MGRKKKEVVPAVPIEKAVLIDFKDKEAVNMDELKQKVETTDTQKM